VLSFIKWALSPPSAALAEQRPGSLSRLRRSKSAFGTLSKKLRSRVRAPSARHMPNNPRPVPTQLTRRQTIYRPQAVPVVLSDDPVSKERREAALRARGLLPSRQPRDLSAIEADADRRIDALRKLDSSSPGSDNGHSDANEIAQAWRVRNSQWQSHSPPNSDSPVDPMTQGPYLFVHCISALVFTDSLYSDASPLDTPSHPNGSSEPPTVGADAPASIVLNDSSSISKSLLPGSLAHSFKAYSSRGSIGHQTSPLSRAASLSPTGPEGPTPSSFNSEDLATGKLTRETSEDITTGSAHLTPGLPVPSTTSRSAGSQLSTPSQRSVSPSSRSEDLQAPHSLDQLPSEPHNTTVQANLSIPAFSPLYLHTTVSDTCLASPTTPTLSPSVCYSSSETEPEDGLATTENGELDASAVSPMAKEEEGGLLCQETILERSEFLSDDDDVDQFHSPTNTALPTVDTHSAKDGRTATPRRTAFLSRLKTRGSTFPPLRPSSPLSTSTSMVNLRRKMSGTLFGRTRRLSTAFDPDAAPRSPPPSPLVIKIYDGSALSAEASGIDDDEARRLSELAFMA
jgi:hypothetical protein